MIAMDEYSLSLIPNSKQLPDFLEIESCVPNYELITNHMLDPLKDILSVDGKKIRFEIVEIAFKSLGGVFDENKIRQLKICDQMIEGLHLGSMIVDDIQDQSEIRRGRPTFHQKYGVGVALNAGNWLYFQALDQIQLLGLSLHKEIYLQRNMNRILVKAHFGQGIDVGVNMNMLPQRDVEPAYFTAAELKTGALMALACELGAVVADSGLEQFQLSKQAKRFGIALQILDDIGNYLAPLPKQKEDLKMGRPSFIWVMAARLATFAEYESFKEAAKALPDTTLIDSWNHHHDLIPKAKAFAAHYLGELRRDFLQSFFDSSSHSGDLKNQIESLFARLEKAYE